MNIKVIYRKILSCVFFSFLLPAMMSCTKQAGFSAKAPKETLKIHELKPDISEVNIPVVLSIPGLEAAINQQLNGLLFEDEGIKTSDNVTIDLKVWKHDQIKMDVVEDEVLYTVPLKIWTHTFFKTSLLGISVEDDKEVDCAVQLMFKSKVSVDSLWKVQTQTTLENYTWIKKPVLQISGMELPFSFIADFVLKNQKEVLLKSIDKEVRDHLDIKPFVVKTWDLMQEPILASTNPQIWLSIKPIKPSIAPFSGQTGKLTSSIGITALVESTFGDKPTVIKKPLPVLGFINQGPDEFKISLIGEISYDQVKKLANEKLIGQNFEFKDSQYKVTLTALDIYPAGELMAIKATLAGSLNGVVYLKGYPVFDSLQREIKLSNVHFDIDTKNKLYKTASWLMHGSLEKKIEKALHYSIADQLKMGENMIRKSLLNNQIAPHILINGSLTSLEPKDIVLTETSIKAIVNATGKLQINVNGF